jgi:hypothetical protein
MNGAASLDAMALDQDQRITEVVHDDQQLP